MKATRCETARRLRVRLRCEGCGRQEEVGDASDADACPMCGSGAITLVAVRFEPPTD